MELSLPLSQIVYRRDSGRSAPQNVTVPLRRGPKRDCPPPPGRGLRTRVSYDSLVPAQDVVVIGGGIIGCAVARAVGRRGVAVRMFEARTVGAGATQASAGILAPYIEGHDRGALFDLGIRSLAMYEGFVRDVCDESGLSVEYR